VLPNGPVGQNGRLHSGDELLEVNGRKLLGLYHTDVVAILKDLPMHVRLVCARSKQTAAQTDLVSFSPISTRKSRSREHQKIRSDFCCPTDLDREMTQWVGQPKLVQFLLFVETMLWCYASLFYKFFLIFSLDITVEKIKQKNNNLTF
jgi:hypothetical protein